MNNYRNQKLTQVILAAAILTLGGSLYPLTVNAQESQPLNTIRSYKIKRQQSNIQITGNITNDPNAPAISCSNLTVEIVRFDRPKTAQGGFNFPVETKLGSTTGTGETTAATCQYSISISSSPTYIQPRSIEIRASGGGLSGKELRSTESLQSSQNIDITLYSPPIIK